MLFRSIGTLGAVGLSRIHWKSKGALEYISILPLMIPEIILGMVLMAFFYMLNLPFGMLTLLIGHTVFCVPYILMAVSYTHLAEAIHPFWGTLLYNYGSPMVKDFLISNACFWAEV